MGPPRSNAVIQLRLFGLKFDSMLSLSKIEKFKKNNPKWDKTIVYIYSEDDELIVIREYDSRVEANEYIKNIPLDKFVVVEYGCN